MHGAVFMRIWMGLLALGVCFQVSQPHHSTRHRTHKTCSGTERTIEQAMNIHTKTHTTELIAKTTPHVRMLCYASTNTNNNWSAHTFGICVIRCECVKVFVCAVFDGFYGLWCLRFIRIFVNVDDYPRQLLPLLHADCIWRSVKKLNAFQMFAITRIFTLVGSLGLLWIPNTNYILKHNDRTSYKQRAN